MAKPNILVVLPAVIPSAKIGVINPLEELKKSGFCDYRVLLESHIARFWENNTELRQLLAKYDAVVMCRNQSAWALNIAIEARRQWIPIIYDIDDNFFDIGLTSEVGRYHRDPLKLYQLEQIIAYSSTVRVYSQPMLKHMQRLNARHALVDSYFDRRIIKHVRRERHRGVVRIAYPTSRTHDDLAEIFVPAALKLFEKYGDKVEIHFWSNVPGPLRRFKGVKQHKPIPNYEEFIRKFYKMGFDIGLAPLKNTIFHRSKTNNKYREYSGCGVAGVYSNVDVYSDCVDHDKNGLLVENTPEAWFEALDRLVAEPDLRKRLTKEAANSLDGRFSLEVTLENWREQITQSLSNAQDQASFPKAPSRPLGLLVIAPPDSEDADSATDRLQERRAAEFLQTGQALGAETSYMKSTPKDVAAMNFAGVAIVVAANIDMVIMSLEMRTRALGLIVDTTPIADSDDLDTLSEHLEEWSEGVENMIFMVRDDLDIRGSDTILRVQKDSIEHVDEYFSAQARLYASVDAIEGLARTLELPPAPKPVSRVARILRLHYFKGLPQRFENFRLFMRGSS